MRRTSAIRRSGAATMSLQRQRRTVHPWRRSASSRLRSRALAAVVSWYGLSTSTITRASGQLQSTSNDSLARAHEPVDERSRQAGLDAQAVKARLGLAARANELRVERSRSPGAAGRHRAARGGGRAACRLRAGRRVRGARSPRSQRRARGRGRTAARSRSVRATVVHGTPRSMVTSSGRSRSPRWIRSPPSAPAPLRRRDVDLRGRRGSDPPERGRGACESSRPGPHARTAAETVALGPQRRMADGVHARDTGG